MDMIFVDDLGQVPKGPLWMVTGNDTLLAWSAAYSDNATSTGVKVELFTLGTIYVRMKHVQAVAY